MVKVVRSARPPRPHTRPSRLAYHGVLPLADGEHALLGRKRINLTFRRAKAG